MDAATRRLHVQLIRLAKGAITAWEAWVSDRAATNGAAKAAAKDTPRGEAVGAASHYNGSSTVHT